MIYNKELLKIFSIPHIEKIVCTHLCMVGYCNQMNELSYKNIVLTDKGREALKISTNELLDDNNFLSDFASHFAPASRCSPTILKERFNVYFQNTPHQNLTREELVHASYIWNLNKDVKYAGLLKYFLYKIDEKKSYTSRLDSIIEQIRSESSPAVNPNYNTETNELNEL